MKWSVGTKIAAAFAMVLAILIAIGTTSFLSTRRMADTSWWVNHTHQVLEALDGVMSRMLAAEAGQKGYLLTNDQPYLDQFNKAVEGDGGVAGRSIDAALENIRQLTGDNPHQKSKADLLVKSVAAKLKLMRGAIDQSKSGGEQILQQGLGRGGLLRARQESAQ